MNRSENRSIQLQFLMCSILYYTIRGSKLGRSGYLCGLAYHSMRKHGIIAADGRSTFEVVLSCMVHLLESTRTGQHRSSQPDSITLVWIIKHLHTDWSRLNTIIFTLEFDKLSNFFNLSSTRSLTLLSNLSLNPLKSVEPPESAMLS